MTDAPSERRGRPRAVVSQKGLVMHARSKAPADFSIRDLSAGGARLVGRERLFEGEQIRVTFELDGVSCVVGASVVRTDPQSSQVAVAFTAVPPAALEAIERAVAALLDGVGANAAPSILLVSTDGETRAALERDLARLGRAARSCVTLDDAMQALGDPTTRYDAVVISNDAGSAAVTELLTYFAEQHPELRRLLLFGEQLHSLDHAASSRVTAVLRTPLRIRALARALGMYDTDPSVAMLPMNDPE